MGKETGPLYWNGSGKDALAESDASGNLPHEYIFFNGKRVARVDLPSAAVHFYFADHLGSSSVVTDAAGVRQAESDFYPYGGEVVILADATANHYKFTGKERDSETGVDYFFARYYSSALGRFLTPDWSATAGGPPLKLGCPILRVRCEGWGGKILMGTVGSTPTGGFDFGLDKTLRGVSEPS